MAFNVLDEVKKQPRKEWVRLARDRWTRLRIWIQENGEAAFCLGLALGFVVVVFHKLFIALLALGVLIGGSLYMLAPEGDDVSAMSDTANGQGGIAPHGEDANAGGSSDAPVLEVRSDEVEADSSDTRNFH
ncbi:MAG: hypothetical protein KDD70_18600 [Bdellovibrionales bacterium]|nr:hypothetical protein [Bdellovibrionales bacterium]